MHRRNIGFYYFGAGLLLSILTCPFGARADELSYPQEIRIRYEAKDPKVGGHVVIWVEREKVWYGLDARLYPPVKYAEIRQVTPTPGSPLVTIIELTTIASTTPEYYHLAGIVRFKVTGMNVASTNLPPAK
jgi:hypothetical protein